MRELAAWAEFVERRKLREQIALARTIRLARSNKHREVDAYLRRMEAQVK